MEYRIFKNVAATIAYLPKGSTYTVGRGTIVEANGMVYRVYTAKALEYLRLKYPS